MYSVIKMHPFMFAIFFSSSFSPLVFVLLYQHRCWHQTQEEGCRQKPWGDTIVTWCIVMQSPTFVILWRVGSRRGSCLAGRDNRSIYQHNFKSTQSRRKKGRVKGPVKHECQRVAFLKTILNTVCRMVWVGWRRRISWKNYLTTSENLIKIFVSK